MSWEIVAGIIALVGFVISIGKIIANNTKALTQLQCSLNALDKTLEKDESELEKVHNKVDDHEIRISKLEGD